MCWGAEVAVWNERPPVFPLPEVETALLCASLGLGALPASPLLSCIP